MDYSVLMSVYYKEADGNLHRCLASIYLQSVGPKEVILVLDGKLTDKLYSTIEYWEAKLPIITVPLDNNVGLGKALNIGLERCSCELVARMDTDDICMPFRFQKQVEEFKKDPTLDICGTYIIEFDSVPNQIISTRVLPTSNDDIVKKCCWINPFNHMTIMYKKSAVERAGGYKHMPWMEDWYLWLRMISVDSKCLNIPEFLVKARTGVGMIERRSGFTYIKSEWMLTKVKVALSLTCWPKSFFIFIVRAVPRVLPKKVLLSLYLIVRRVL